MVTREQDLPRHLFRFLPFAWLQDVLVPKTLALLETGKGHPLTLGELMRYIGMCLLMATLQGWTVAEFWDYSGIQRPQEDGPCPYNFRTMMTYTRFNAIMASLVFTSAQLPAFRDKFWQIREMVREWNLNMREFIAGWVLCLDESMSI
jgi:hypothetical protein